MREILLNPPPSDIAKFGILAYVTTQERTKILQLPHGRSTPAIKRLEREVEEAQKRERLQIENNEVCVNAMPNIREWRDMTRIERMRVEQLQHVRCRITPKETSFIADIRECSRVTDKQAAYIKHLAYKYRGQM